MQCGLRIGTVDLETGTIRGPREGQLSPIERRLLAALAAHPGQPQRQEALLDAVWGDRSKKRSLYATIQRLRQKIERNPAAPDHVLTVHGQYQFQPLRPTSPRAQRNEHRRLPLDAFVPRPRATERLERWLHDPSAPIAALVGAPGAGVSRLALEFGFAQQGGPCCHVDAFRLTSAYELVLRVAQELRIAHLSGRLAERTARLLSPAGGGLLIVEHLATPALLPDAWRHQAGLKILLVAPIRNGPWPCIALDPMSHEQARRMLCHRLQGVWPRWSSEADDLDGLASAAHGMPLALEILSAARLSMSTPELLDGVRGTRSSTLVPWAWQQLSRSERRVLQTLGALPQPMSRTLLATLVPEQPLAMRLGHLVRCGLVHRAPEADRYHLPQTVHRFVTEEHPLPDDARQALQQAGEERYRPWATLAATEARLQRGTSAEQKLLRDQLPWVHAFFERATGQAKGELCRILVSVHHFEQRGELNPPHIDQVDLSSCSDELRVWLLRMRADALRGMGDIDGGREQLRQARTLAAATAPEIEGHVVQMQAFLEQLHGGLDEATRRYEEALGIHRAVGDGYRTGLALGQLATLLRIQGDVVGAIPGFLHAIAQLEAVQAVRAVANYQSELAAAYSTLGRFAEAEAELEAAVANCRLAGADRFELGCRSKLALLHATRGDFERAAGIREQLLAIWLDEGDETESAILRSSLAEAQLRLGHVEEALRGFEVSAAAFAHLKLSHYLTMNRLGACAAHRLVGNPTQARACLHEVASSPRVLDNLEAHPWALAEEGLLAEEPARAHACFVEATRRLETQPSHAASHAVWAWEALRERVFSDPEGS